MQYTQILNSLSVEKSSVSYLVKVKESTFKHLRFNILLYNFISKLQNSQNHISNDYDTITEVNIELHVGTTKNEENTFTQTILIFNVISAHGVCTGIDYYNICTALKLTLQCTFYNNIL